MIDKVGGLSKCNTSNQNNMSMHSSLTKNSGELDYNE